MRCPARALGVSAAEVSRRLKEVQQEAPAGRSTIGGIEQSLRAIATVQDAQWILGQCPHLHGFYGASSLERLPSEQALTAATRDFVAMEAGSTARRFVHHDEKGDRS